ncbi:glycosyltransferase family 52 [Vibrio artabrorum]|uniref:glycosyltransferase family 52 n=1 Tax=Vibrio artabrorum TaxID=446374 RepID=UPI00354D6110
MDLYMCSTLRHFMFALLRASKNAEQNSLIIVILDQQGLDEKQFDLSTLPRSVSVKFVNRKLLLRRVYRGLLGFAHKLYATALISSTYFKRRTRKLVLEDELGFDQNTEISLFLFNDRNRLARLLRHLVNQYQVIEDGLSNYSGSPLSAIERLFSINRQNRYFGDDVRCTNIFLLNKDSAPKAINSKVSTIDFVDTDIVNDFLLPIFKVDRSSLDHLPQVLIATQPISIAGMSKSEVTLKVYQEVVNKLKKDNISYQFKVHPRENEDKYREFFPMATFVDSKTPLELLLFSQRRKLNIVSIYSSAGMGFEKFCNRITLIDDEEAERQGEIYLKWSKSMNGVKRRLEDLNFD